MKENNNFLPVLFFAVLVWCIVPYMLTAQWSTNPLVNNAISTYPYYDKFVPAIVSDGAGGAIITWEDSRDDGSFFDIYAQRINGSGNIVWTADGVAISTGPEDRRAPAIVSDGAGGAIITWKDSRTGYGAFDIYAQRINASGVVQWTADGAAICTATGVQEDQKIVSDGSGGAIITWVDQRSGNGAGYKIYAQRIDSDGSIHAGWTTDGVSIRSNLSGSVQLPTIVGDGSAGAIITWSDYRSLSNYDIYAQKINASGDTVWTANGVAICTFAGTQGRPKIVTDGSAGAIISWIDERTTNGDVYAQRINSSGAVQWTANGVAICSQPSSIQGNHNIIGDGSGGAIITWQDNRSGNYDIYAQQINASGAVQWTADGIGECAATDDQYFPAIVSDGAGGAIISWHDNRLGTSSFDIYAQRINSSGAAQWTADGAAVCTNGGWQGYTSITDDGASGAIITWYDYRAGYNSDIYASQIDANGNLGAGALPVELVSFVAVNNRSIVDLKWKTATEINNYGFEIERKQIPIVPAGHSPFVKMETSEVSTGQSSGGFIKIGFVEGNGTTNSPKSYSFVDANASGKVMYRLKQIDRNGKFEYSQSIEVEIGAAPKDFALLQNYPNPFNPTTTISYQLSTTNHVSLEVYDAVGREVTSLVNEMKEAGNYLVQFDASKLSSGIYIVKLQSGNKVQMKKIVLMK